MATTRRSGLVDELEKALRDEGYDGGFGALPPEHFTDYVRTLAATAAKVVEERRTPAAGSYWDAAPRVVLAGEVDPTPTLCELTAGHHGARRSGRTQWMHSRPLTPTDDEREALIEQSDYTPTMERLRADYPRMRAERFRFTDLYAAEWDRALAAHGAEVRAESAEAHERTKQGAKTLGEIGVRQVESRSPLVEGNDVIAIGGELFEDGRRRLVVGTQVAEDFVEQLTKALEAIEYEDGRIKWVSPRGTGTWRCRRSWRHVLNERGTDV